MSAQIPRFSLNGDGKQPIKKTPDERKKKVVETLDSRFKMLNKLWENAEADLKKIHIPVDVRYCYKMEDADSRNRPGRCEISHYLGFVRTHSGWRICYDVAHEDFPECDWHWKPITECHLDVRLEAAPHIGELRLLVLKAAEECVPSLDKAIEDFRKTLETW